MQRQNHNHQQFRNNHAPRKTRTKKKGKKSHGLSLSKRTGLADTASQEKQYNRLLKKVRTLFPHYQGQGAKLENLARDRNLFVEHGLRSLK